jgi:hypothetical protein
MNTLNPIQLIDPAGSTSGQALVSTGPSTPPAWSPIGEEIKATGSGIALNNGAPAVNVTSISLTAGDWEVTGIVTFSPAGTTTMSEQAAGISTASATLTANQYHDFLMAVSAGAGNPAVPTPAVRINVSATTTVYLVAFGRFAVSTCTVGGVIRAKRVH